MRENLQSVAISFSESVTRAFSSASASQVLRARTAIEMLAQCGFDEERALTVLPFGKNRTVLCFKLLGVTIHAIDESSLHAPDDPFHTIEILTIFFDWDDTPTRGCPGVRVHVSQEASLVFAYSMICAVEPATTEFGWQLPTTKEGTGQISDLPIKFTYNSVYYYLPQASQRISLLRHYCGKLVYFVKSFHLGDFNAHLHPAFGQESEICTPNPIDLLSSITRATIPLAIDHVAVSLRLALSKELPRKFPSNLQSMSRLFLPPNRVSPLTIQRRISLNGDDERKEADLAKNTGSDKSYSTKHTAWTGSDVHRSHIDFSLTGDARIAFKAFSTGDLGKRHSRLPLPSREVASDISADIRWNMPIVNRSGDLGRRAVKLASIAHTGLRQ